MSSVSHAQVSRRSIVRGGLGVAAGLAAVPLAARAGGAAELVADLGPDGRTLSRGDTGRYVKAWQHSLANHGYWCGSADGTFGHLTQQATWAVQKQNGLEKDGVVGPLTRNALSHGPLPRPVGGSGARVEVHLKKQLLLVVSGGKTQRVFNTSTGNGEYYWLHGKRYRATTPTGTWNVYSSYSGGWQNGDLGRMWRPMYYNSGWAVHGSESIPTYPASHGCSRLSTAAMDLLWSTGAMYVGSRVVIATGA